MNELDVVLRARRLSAQISADQLPPSLDAYAKAAGEAVIRLDPSLGDDEAGHTVVIGGRRFIVVNENDRPERQRFTICHEIAHIVLGLPTEHSGHDAQFARSPNEVLCDVFAAELLLPCHLFKPKVDDSDIGFEAVDSLRKEFIASQTATASRFATVCDRPCAFVLSKDGLIRYSSRSTALRDCGGWVRPKVKLPRGSFAAQLIASGPGDGPREVTADEWFENWERGGSLLEDSRHYPRWALTLTLLWFEDDQVPSGSSAYLDDDDDELALKPLDGNLPWPGKSRRRP